MPRPRKNRIGDYARLLGDELGHQLREEVARSLAAHRRAHEEEVAALRAELRAVTRRLDALLRRERTPRPRLGRWVPGGPGRPPKDAADRIAAFEARLKGPATEEKAVPRTRRKRGR